MYFLFLFFVWVFFHEHSRIIRLQGKEEGISLTPHYHFYPLHRHSGISLAIIAESSPLHLAAELELGTFDFQAQVANHWPTHPEGIKIVTTSGHIRVKL